MRVISGFFKGRKLKASTDLSIRPATDRVKEYIFNILQDFPQGRQVTDIFAGSGGLGIEALSRGASQAVFVDSASTSLKILKENLQNIKVPEDKYRIVQKDAIHFVTQDPGQTDLCFMDPPYKYPPLQELLDLFFRAKLLKKNGILVLEHEVSNPVKEESPVYHIFKQKKIGRSIIRFIEQGQNNDQG